MNKKYIYLIVIVLIIATLAAYGRILSNGFVNYDDGRLITENNYVQTGFTANSIKWAFTDFRLEYWHPLTWLSIMLEWRLFGTNAFFYHLVSLLLHIGAVLFLFLFLNKATKHLWPSAFAAALFALHPLRVESVAWAAEHKDVLSMFFGMATLYAYAYYVEKPQRSKYFVCLLLFALSLMSKPTLTTLPCILLLLDYWPLERWKEPFTQVNIPETSDNKNGNQEGIQRKKTTSIASLLWEKVPFFLLSMLLSIMLIGQLRANNSMLSFQQIPFPHRVMNTIVSYVTYLGKTFWPVDLAVFYPHHFFPQWQVIGAVCVLLAITVGVIYLIKRTPFLAVGWFWYLGALFPVSGLMQSGAQSMADRYTYLPSIGIAVMLAWGIPLLMKSEDIRKRILFPLGVVSIAILSLIIWKQCGYWNNSIELWNHALKTTDNNYTAHNNLGFCLFEKGMFKEAIDHYSMAIIIKPDHVRTYNNRGLAYAKLGQYKLAIEDFNETIRQQPEDSLAYFLRGNSYAQLGQYQNAMKDYNEAIRLKPDYVEAYNNRGNIYGQRGQYQMAIEDFNKIIGLSPNYVRAYNNRGLAYSKLRQYKNAIEDFSKAINLKQNYADAWNNRALSYLSQRDKISGCRDANKACELGNCKTWESTGRILCR